MSHQAWTAFFTGQMDFIYLCYSLSFVLLGAFCLLLHKRSSRDLSWLWLGLFGFSHGLYELLELGAFLATPAPAFVGGRLALQSLSFFFLFEFGRRGHRGAKRWWNSFWLYLLPALGLSAGAVLGTAQFQAYNRYFLALPGALLSGVALWQAGKNQERWGRWLLSAAAASLWIYALGTGLVVAPADHGLGRWLNTDTFFAVCAIPIQLVRGILAFVLALAVWRWFLYEKNREYLAWQGIVSRRRHFWLIPLLLMTLAGGWLVAEEVSLRLGRQLRGALLEEVKIGAAAVQPELLRPLSEETGDHLRQEDLHLQAQLTHMAQASPAIRYIHMIQQRQGQIFFLVEAAPTEQNVALSGDPYPEMSPVLQQVFLEGRSLTEGPRPGPWGNTLLAVVPIREREGGPVLAALVFGIDGAYWQRAIQHSRAALLAVTYLFSLLLIAGAIIFEYLRAVAHQIRVSEERYRHLFGSMASGFAYCRLENDTAGRPGDFVCLEVNDSFEKITGLARAEVLERRGSEWFPPLEGSTTPPLEIFRAVAQEGQPQRFEGFSPERQRWYDIAAYRPQPGFFVITFLDVTERRLQEERKREALQMVQRIMDAIPNPVFYKDRLGRYLGCNDAFCKMIGYARDEIVGRTVFDLNAPDLAKLHYAQDQAIYAHPGIQSYECSFVNRDGKSFNIILCKSTYADPKGEVAGLVGVMLDISERKRSEERLAKLNSTFLSFGADPVENIGWLVTMCGELLQADWAMYSRLEGEKLRAVGVWNLPEGFAVERPVAGTICHRVLETKGKEVLTADFTAEAGAAAGNDGLRACGVKTYVGRAVQRQRQVVGVLCLLYQRNVEPTAEEKMLVEIVASAVGIEEERMNAEQTRLQLETRLQQIQKQQSLTTMAGGFAHDFNNLLMVILGNASMAKSSSALDSSLRGNLEAVEQASKRAALIISQMLAFAGKEKNQPGKVHLAAVLRDLSRLLQASMPRQVQLKLEMADDVPLLLGDEQALRQVIISLVDNAVEAIGRQPGEIQVSAGAAVVNAEEASALQPPQEVAPGSYVFLEVADDGCGMDEETQHHIFDPFFSTKFTGRGLGLAAVMGTVRAHRGGIRVHSQPGRGTRMRLLFPTFSSKTRFV